MNIENPKDILDSKIHQKALLRGDFSDIWKEKITQRELRLKNSMQKLIFVLYKYKKLNKSEILKKTGLYWASVMRVCEVAETKQIVTVKQYNDKKNNAKFYFLRKNRAIVYIHHLFYNNPQKLKNQRQFIESLKIILNKMPKDFMKSQLYIDNKTKKRLRINIEKEHVTIKELLRLSNTNRYDDPFKLELYLNKFIPLIRIIQYILNEQFCENCIKTLPIITKCIRCNNPNCHITNCNNCIRIFNKEKMEKFPTISLTELLSEPDNEKLERCTRCGHAKQIFFRQAVMKGSKSKKLGTMESEKYILTSLKRKTKAKP